MEETYLFENNLQCRFVIQFTLRNLTHTYYSYGAGEWGIEPSPRLNLQ